jgi:molybdopterin synthase sulfur carrier subunit
MPTVWIPAPLRTLTNQQETVRIPGGTVREVIDQLDAQFPGIKARLCEGDSLRRGMVVAIDAEVSRLGLEQTVGDNNEVHFLPAIGGG